MITQTGTLTRNTNRQSQDDSTPPSIGPAADATAPPAAQTPNARARGAESGKASRTRVIDAGSISAAAMP